MWNFVAKNKNKFNLFSKNAYKLSHRFTQNNTEKIFFKSVFICESLWLKIII